MPNIQKATVALSTSSLSIKLLREQEIQHDYMSDSGLLQSPRALDLNGAFKERELSVLLKLLAKLFDKITDSDAPPFVPAARRTTRLPAVYKLTSLGRTLRANCVQFLKQGDDNPDWVRDYADHLFSPMITVMLRAMKRWAADTAFLPNSGSFEPVDDYDKAALDAINRIVAFVRRVSASRKFENAWNDYIRQSNANFRSGSNFIYLLFSRHTRLLVLRVDCYLRPDSRAWGLGDEADAHAVKLLRKLRDGNIVPGYLGAIIKRENGIKRGMHWHWMIFMNANSYESACYYSKAIGEAWMKLVGNHRASYFNCYTRRHEHKFNGLGIVHLNDIEKLIGIRAALHYMTKRDCVLRATSGKQQDFRRSKPRIPNGSQRGPKRKESDSLREVKRALGGTRSRYPAWLES
ncbi:inovirus-type Gp2 protein [Xanthomonas hortorum]|uniref:inovirus-type Gp2 protein n=1 Tax=Xanthomonas hortorum TaxID=56454 RepID=UPI001592F411|nr:inovirus-type Gp2 protein [Xanthomonas hortorum]NHF65976.1 inovirus Gp2 family protein [Xanthomonas hortorum]